MKIFKLLALLFFLTTVSKAQINAVKVTYERKTNLYKKYKEHDVKDWMREEDKIKIDYFDLFVTDTASVFRPQVSELRETFSWATSKNSVCQNFNRGTRYLIKNIWGEEMHLTDSIIKRNWKIGSSSRNIAGYQCRKAVWQANDSTRIYAWFSYDIQPSTGPESFNGLPGTILGLATEDGGVVYFAKKVEVLTPTKTDMTLPKKKRIYSVQEVKDQMTKQYGHEKWFKKALYEQFGIW